MDFTESTKVVYNRIQQLEPENVSKIIGYLLLQDHGDRDMIRLAFGPDTSIQSLIKKAKSELNLNRAAAVSAPVPLPLSLTRVNLASVADPPVHYVPYSPASSRPISSSPPAIRANSSPYQLPVDHQQGHDLEFVQPGYTDPVAEDYRLQKQIQLLSLEEQVESSTSVSPDFLSNYYYSEPFPSPRTSRRSPSLPEFPVKLCHYFNKGFCKHGNSCRYFHGHPTAGSFFQIFNPSMNEVGNDDHVFSPGSLDKLESELTELLKSRRGLPVSIASLPMLYYEKYGRMLQAEGYLTESQRHGKAGYSLTKLLARLKNTICLIDRPHGQHSVILTEDVPKYLEYIGEKGDAGGIVAGSRQIYLTFPAESTFTEQDVSSYFNKFGPVQDVRIPCQQKRMFGFVTFLYPETVKQILAKGNPHFVCGARVLVKPYREKSRVFDRKYVEKAHHPMHHGGRCMDWDNELQSIPRVIRKQLLEDQEQTLELETRHPSEFKFIPKQHLAQYSYFGHSMNNIKLTDARIEHLDFPSAERFNYLLDVLNTGSTSEDKGRQMSGNCSDQDSNQGLNHPDGPFASAIGSGISTVIQ